MRFLLDSHVLVWWQADDARLGPAARGVLADPESELVWSAASTWELGIKAATKRLTLPLPFALWVGSRVASLGGVHLPVSHDHAVAAAALPPHHRDPFDRMLVAQAVTEGLTLVSADPLLRQYGVDLLW